MPVHGPKPDVERRAAVARMRDSGMAFGAIGRALVPPVTKQAARLLYHAHVAAQGCADKNKAVS